MTEVYSLRVYSLCQDPENIQGPSILDVVNDLKDSAYKEWVLTEQYSIYRKSLLFDDYSHA